MKRFLICSVLMLTFGFSLNAAAEENAPAPGANAVREEMILLDNAFKNLIDALILNNPQAIPGAFRELHAARVRTDAALEKGEARLPKNSDKMALFKQLDARFHMNLEALMEASKKGDMKRVNTLTHRLLNGCVQCHNGFRN